MIGKKVKNPSKGSSKAARAGGLADYIRAPELTNEQEKCAYSNGRGFLTDSHQGQRAEMIALAQEAVRSKDPINHYVLSWREGEQPTPAQVEQAVDVLLDQMNLQGHQVIYGLHADTDNYHLHVAINRVHPDTLKPVEINKGFDIEALHQAVARIEQAQGWQREKNARYHIQDSGELKRTDVGSTVKKIDRRTVDMEVRTGEKSAKRIGIEEAGPVIKNANTWQELHAGLAALGMRYEREGSGAKVFIGEVGIKASDVDRNASIGKLQKRLGLYQSAGQEKPHDYHHHTPQPYPHQARTLSGNGMRRLSKCRMASNSGHEKAPGVLHINARPGRQQADGVRRTAGRSTGRSEPLKQNQPGWQEYTTGRQAEKAARTQRNADLKARHDAERKALAFRQKAERTHILSGDWRGKGDLLNAMRSVLAAQQAAAKLDLREQHKAERQAMQQQHRPYPTYEQFLRERGGQELAERWRYKDSPDKQPCIITGKTAQQIPPRDIRDFEHRIVGREVSYRLRGAGGFGPEAFIDRGKNIAVLDYKSPAAVTAALQLAAQKFGGKITVTGNDEYKRLCVQLATQHGIQIVNPELQPLIAAEKQRIEQQRTAEREAAAEQKRVKAQMQTKENEGKEAQTQAKTVEQPQTTAKAPSLSKPSTQPEGLEAQPTALDLDRVFNTYLTPIKSEHAQFAADLTTRANAKEAEQQPSHITPDMLTGQPLSIDQMKALDKELDRLQAIAKGAALELKTNQERPPEELTPAQLDAQGIQLAKQAINIEAAQKWPTVDGKAFPEDQYQGDRWQIAATVSQEQLADHLKTPRPLLRNAEWDQTKERLETEAKNWKGGIEWREKRLADLKPAKVAEALKAHAKAQQEATAKRAAAFKQAAKKLHQVEQQMEKTGTALFSQPEPLQREYKQVRELELKQELEKAQALALQRPGMGR